MGKSPNINKTSILGKYEIKTNSYKKINKKNNRLIKIFKKSEFFLIFCVDI